MHAWDAARAVAASRQVKGRLIYTDRREAS